jgi:hypothetical protein
MSLSQTVSLSCWTVVAGPVLAQAKVSFEVMDVIELMPDVAAAN